MDHNCHNLFDDVVILSFVAIQNSTATPVVLMLKALEDAADLRKPIKLARMSGDIPIVTNPVDFAKLVERINPRSLSKLDRTCPTCGFADAEEKCYC